MFWRLFHTLLHSTMVGGTVRRLDTDRFLLPHIFRLKAAITTNNSSENVTTSHTTCPKCQQTLFVEIGKVATCPVCHASQLHGEPESNEKWRTCPNCSLLFQAAQVNVVSCPNCQTNQIHSDSSNIVEWERNDSAPRVHTDLSQPDTLVDSPHRFRRTVFQLFFSHWHPYQAAIERFFVTLWPSSLFTFTTEERRALRLAARGTYKFSEIKDPRLAKWLTRRGGSSAISGLEIIQPEIAKHLVKTRESLRLNGIKFIDEQLANSLVRHNGRTLYLDSLHHVDIEVLEILVTHGGRGLSLGGIKTLSIQEAAILARYRGRLSLNSLSYLNSEVLAALVQHTGKSMSLASLKTLSYPQAQQLKQYRGDLYLRGIQELPPGINSEFKDFPGKIVLMHYERRPAKTHASVKTTVEDRGARIALGFVAFACLAALFALVVAALKNI